MAAGRHRRAASPGAQRLLPGIGKRGHARSPGPGVPTARSSAHRPGTGLYRPLRTVPRKRPGAAALLVRPAPRTAGSRQTSFLGACGGRVQGGASALKGTGHGAREAAPFETARGACCGAGHTTASDASFQEALSGQPQPLQSLCPEPGIMAEKVLVTGGAGYIGSHTVLELLEAGYSPMVIDNFHNAIRGGGSMPESLRRVQELTGRSVEFEEMDILDQAALQRLFKKHSFMAVIHFAGLKAVGESVQKPLDYYRVNLTGTIQLLEIMRAHGVKNLVFSSSATVYGNPQYLPLDEAHPTGGCTNPYGKSKFFIEEMIRDLCQADKAWNAVLLRYFNPIGAHASGCIGEDPQGIPNNLMPYVSQVAIGRREVLNVFGNDYDTEDGTGVRDYIHVVDLAKGHIAALRKLKEQCGCRIYNLGTGTGYSVLQMVQAMEKASGKKIPYKVVARREGDVAACYANPSLALKELGWSAALGLDRMCEDLWRWQKQNPSGFGTQA
ncbi:UDP-glucose 4-epimerase [Moschus berezovskii]|nr:UDP-glucose 4-epimerase [Moschus berezovskii]